MEGSIYDSPELYDLAFSFRDFAKVRAEGGGGGPLGALPSEHGSACLLRRALHQGAAERGAARAIGDTGTGACPPSLSPWRRPLDGEGGPHCGSRLAFSSFSSPLSRPGRLMADM